MNNSGPDEIRITWWQIPQAAIERIRSSYRLEDVVSIYTRLHRSGRSLVGLCPLHKERTASFHIFPEDQHYKCFGCGASGDLFDFVEKIRGLGFAQVVEELAQQKGISLDARRFAPDPPRPTFPEIERRRGPVAISNAELRRRKKLARFDWFTDSIYTPEVNPEEVRSFILEAQHSLGKDEVPDLSDGEEAILLEEYLYALCKQPCSC